jgi:hypothetical protein
MLDAAWAVGQAVMFDVMGVPATVTRAVPHDTPIETVLIWVDRSTPESPDGARVPRRDVRRIAVLNPLDVDTIPTGTRVAAPELQGGVVRQWKVDGIDRVDADQVRVVLIGPLADSC